MNRNARHFIFAMLLLLCAWQEAAAQFRKVEIGVNGLTCSQCTRTVEMSLRKLDFVAEVDMNLQHTEGKITFKANSRPDMDKIAQAVIDAGFSVRYLKAEVSDIGRNAEMTEKDRFDLDHNLYVFTETPKKAITGNVEVKFLGKKFLPKNEYKKVEQAVAKATGVKNTNGKVYCVQLVE